MSEPTKEWSIGVALTIAVLVVLTAVSSIKSSSYLAESHASHALASDRASAFKAESIKEHRFRLQMEVFELKKLLGKENPDVQKFIEQKVREYDEQLARYEQEQNLIKQQLDEAARDQTELERHHKSLIMAVIMLQVAILASSLGALLGRRIMWGSGVCIALVGVGYMASGFFF